jgi:hypothetical protein
MWFLVGSRLRNLAVSVLAAVVFIIGLIQYGRQTQKHKQEVRDLKDYKETRERIDEVEVSPDRDSALERLRRNKQVR